MFRAFQTNQALNFFPKGFIAHFGSFILGGHFEILPKQVTLSESKLSWLSRHSSTFPNIDTTFIYGRPINTSKTQPLLIAQGFRGEERGKLSYEQ